MRTFLIAATAAMALGAAAPAHAFTVPAGGGLTGAADAVGIVDDAQVMVYGGRQYCFYLDAWNGAGWYRCGYAWRQGIGFGGFYGWNRWYSPRHHARYYHGRGWDRRRAVRRDGRNIRRNFRQEQRQNRSNIRRDSRQDRRGVRQERRGDRQQMRQQRGGDRQQMRQQRQQQIQGQRGGGDRGGMRGGGGNRGSMSGGGGGRGGMGGGGGGGGMGGGGGGRGGGGGGMGGGGGGGGGMGGGR